MNRLRTARSIASAERGAAVVMALLALMVLTAFGLTLVGLGMTEVSISSNWRDYTKDFYAAEAGLESGVSGLKVLLQSNPVSLIDQTKLNGVVAPTLNTPGTSYNTYSITPVIPFPNNTYTTQMASGQYVGLFGIVSSYQIRAQVNGQAGTKADLAQLIQYTGIPLFQFGVFYGKGVDLEISAQPNMTFNGRVHSNSNIYLSAGSTMSFDSYMTTAGGIYRTIHLAGDSTPYRNDPTIKGDDGAYHALNFDSTYQPGFLSTWATPAAWAAQVSSTFGTKVQDSAMGVAQITPPIPDLFNNPSNPDVVAHKMIEMPQAGDSAGMASAKLYSQAGLRIIDGAATNASGGPVTLPFGALTMRSLYDERENKTMTVYEIDVAIMRTQGAFPSNGIVYVAGQDMSTNPAVRLVNGSQLPSQGLTVVSQNPIYIKGDYNTVSKVAAAVMGDAVTVLSNEWNDTTTVCQLCLYAKTLTTNVTVNAAIATGPNVESTTGKHNGGLENSIRFLEHWGGHSLTYSGSIISLWHSQQATGSWNGNYYQPPTRIWSYDTLFNTTPPPGTPQGVIIVRGRWSQS